MYLTGGNLVHYRFNKETCEMYQTGFVLAPCPHRFHCNKNNKQWTCVDTGIHCALYNSKNGSLMVDRKN